MLCVLGEEKCCHVCPIWQLPVGNVSAMHAFCSYEINPKEPPKKCENLTPLKFLDLSEVRIFSIILYKTREDDFENKVERII